jgi:hypothetical protein
MEIAWVANSGHLLPFPRFDRVARLIALLGRR